MTMISPDDRLDAAREQAALWCVRLADDDPVSYTHLTLPTNREV